MANQTTNYGLVKPDVNSATDEDLWGNEINGDWDDTDGLLYTAINFIKSAQTATFSISAPISGTTNTGDNRKLFRCDATAGIILADLPAASAAGIGFTVAVKKVDSSDNGIAITPFGSDKIDGASSFVIRPQFGTIVLVSDGVSSWDVMSNYFPRLSVTSSISKVSPVSILDGVPKSVTSLSLSPGIWEVYAIGGVVGTGSTFLSYYGLDISSTDNVQNTDGSEGTAGAPIGASGITGRFNWPIGPRRITVSATQNVYLVAQCGFSTSTLSAYGTLTAQLVG